MPRLTVLLPAYNAAGTISRAVRSTLADLPRDCTLHVIDDASTDTTLEILVTLAENDHRIRVTASGVNQGVAGALNQLLARNDSEFVARMDADDIVIPGRFRRALSILDRGGVDLLFGNIVHFGAGMRFRPAAPVPISPSAMPLQLLVGNPVAHSTLVARRHSMGDGYRDVPSEDYDLWLRLGTEGHRIRRVGTPALLYRHHERQVTAGTEWKDAAVKSARTADAHARLAELVLGTRFEVFELLRRPSQTADEAAAVACFLQRVMEAAGTLTRIERTDLNRKCRKLLRERVARESSNV